MEVPEGKEGKGEDEASNITGVRGVQPDTFTGVLVFLASLPNQSVTQTSEQAISSILFFVGLAVVAVI